MNDAVNKIKAKLEAYISERLELATEYNKKETEIKNINATREVLASNIIKLNGSIETAEMTIKELSTDRLSTDPEPEGSSGG